MRTEDVVNSTLENFVPICAWCKKIRIPGSDPKDQDNWKPVEAFVAEKTGAQLSHGICPGCMMKMDTELM